MPSFRATAGRIFLAVLLTVALPVQWQASCGGWQSPEQAIASCHSASHDKGPSAAISCCAAQEQTRQAQSPVAAMPAISLQPAHLPVPAAATVRFHDESPRRARSGNPRLLASVFLI